METLTINSAESNNESSIFTTINQGIKDTHTAIANLGIAGVEHLSDGLEHVARAAEHAPSIIHSLGSMTRSALDAAIAGIQGLRKK